ncbi:outer membrane protein assembly factor BamB family protein [Streptomyces sp. MUM 178J]|uniref:outer membrane protein assembly factor BamB family protein n=1 Tax=Streptomyces sp. MUM 178J TaxID=2791991 RepID=UPI001F044930|nr:PQQ-binding-like beta-propeller repeat protein [Streptomyces sp. MUM 178J]WRQ80420.1 PQQ-binding-like beta-propeller repeat protein [Streptomyces sp. MUM 178J]
MEPRRPQDPGQLGRFTVLCRIGSGGFGDVFLAREHDRRSRRLAAIKLIKQDVADSERLRPRFRSEIEAVSRAGGQGIPELLDADPAAARPWLATRYIPGPCLQQLVDRAGPLHQEAVWALAAGLAGTLTDLHKVGLYHRDLKPSNVLITRVRPWVIDFSLVRLVGDPSLTATADAMGSFQYAAPEQAAGLGRAQGQADVFALGATLLFAATGHPPYSGRNQLDIRLRALTESPDMSGLERGELRGLVGDCLEFEAGDRPEAAAVLQRAEEAVGAVRPRRLPLPGPALRVLDEHRAKLRAVAGVDDDFTEYDEVAVPRPAAAWYEPPKRREPAVRTRWQWHCYDWLRAAPAVLGALVLAVTADGVLYAVDRADGTTRWRLDLGAAARGGLAAAGDSVAVATADATLHMVRLVPDGPLHSRVQLPAPARAVAYAPALRPGGPRLLIVAGRLGVTALEAEGRVVRWTAAWAGAAGRPALDGGSLYVRTADGALAALALADGALLWRPVPSAGAAHAAPAVAEGRVFSVSADGSAMAVDAASGEVLWRHKFDGTVHLAPVAWNGLLLVGSAQGRVWALDAARGREIWQQGRRGHAGLAALAPPCVRTDARVDARADAAPGTPDRESALLADRDGICALSSADGSEVWRWRVRNVANLWSGPGELVVGGLDGTLRSVHVDASLTPLRRREDAWIPEVPDTP